MTIFEELQSVFLIACGSLLWVAPWVLGATVLSVLITRARLQDKVTDYVKRRPHRAIFGAAVLGAILPVCSCTVLPLARGLLRSGITLPVLMAFWAAAPIIGIAKIFTTSAFLGPEYGVALVGAALMIGVGGAYFLKWMGSSLTPADLPEDRSCCLTQCASARPRLWKEIWDESFKLTCWLFLAFLMEGALVTWVPLDWVPGVLGSENSWSIPLAVTVGAPLYFNHAAGLGVGAGLLNAGASPGAVFGLFVAGSMTSIPAVVATVKLLGWQLLRRYLWITLFGSLFVSFLFQALV